MSSHSVDKLRNILQKYPMIISSKFFAIGALLSFAVGAAAAVVQPDDGPYYRLRRGRILYVYDSVARDSVPQIAGYMEALRTMYDDSFHWKLDEEEDLILTSPNQQIANAYATVSPNIASLWYPSGGMFLEESAESSWFLALATHETSHLYQLNSKGKFNSFFKDIFGNVQVVELPLFIPIWIHPNQLTPTFLIEGNAVMNESRANLGGRLYSGEYRALVLSEIKAGEITPTRLINREFRFPFGQLPYAQGGYFEGHLAAKHGVDKTNDFFLAQGERWYWPLMLNNTFREHFGASYPQEIREFVREMQPLADKQKTSEGRVLAESLYFSPLNHDDERIFFLAAGGIYPSELRVLDKKRKTASREKIDLPIGKIFFEDGEPEAAASDRSDLHHITYSLYRDGHYLNQRFAGQLVSDQRAGKTVALDAGGAWLENHVLVNGEAYDVAHSMPILDKDGNVYYFRQNGSERILYKNRQPVFKYDGFYGKLMEVGADGGVYFIGNTHYGSTLYEYKDREILRVLPSDVVVDARLVDDSNVLAVEVGPSGHRAVLTEAERTPAQPATYSYGFPSYNLQPEKVADPEQFKADERSYNSLAELRYSGANLLAGFDSANGFGGLVDAVFVDPLQYNLLDVNAGGTQLGGQAYRLGYAFTKYLPQLQASYVYQRELWHSRDELSHFTYNQQVLAGFTLPLLHHGRWDAAWSLKAQYHKDSAHIETNSGGTTTISGNQEETWGTFNLLSLSRTDSPDPGIGYYPWEAFNLTFANKLTSLPGQWRKKYNTSLLQAQYSHGFPLQFYASLTGDVAWAENNDIGLSYDQYSLVQDIRIQRLVPHNYYTVKTASVARFELSKVFDLLLYSPRIPVSLERVAPLVVAQGMSLDSNGENNGGYPGSIFEWGFGADVQLLVFHLASAKLRLIEAFDTAEPVHPKNDSTSSSLVRGGDLQVQFTTKYTF